jgi:hypothetical protein
MHTKSGAKLHGNIYLDEKITLIWIIRNGHGSAKAALVAATGYPIQRTQIERTAS